MPAIDCPLTSCVSSHEKLWEKLSVHRKERANTPEDSYWKNWKKICAAVCKVFLICTCIFTAFAAKVLPEQERILSHTSAWMSLKGDLSNYSKILPFQYGLFISSQLIATHLAWLVLLQHTNRRNQNYLFVSFVQN